MNLDGLKAIASELERLWRVTVSTHAVWRYIRTDSDPLPATVVKRRVTVESSSLEEWAARQVRQVRVTQ
jgi:hypothetical protein